MRLVLTIRGVNVVDLELRWPGKPSGDSEPPKLEASGGGQAERAEQYGATRRHRSDSASHYPRRESDSERKDARPPRPLFVLR